MAYNIAYIEAVLEHGDSVIYSMIGVNETININRSSQNMLCMGKADIAADYVIKGSKDGRELDSDTLYYLHISQPFTM
jgi:hypothetical protein